MVPAESSVDKGNWAVEREAEVAADQRHL